MLRTLFCGLLAATMVAGVANAKPPKHKGHEAHGKFVAFSNGTLTVDVVHHKKGDKTPTVEQKTFTIPDTTPVYIAPVTEGDKPTKTTAATGFDGVKKGTSVHIRFKEDKSIAGVGIGFHHHKKAAKPKE